MGTRTPPRRGSDIWTRIRRGLARVRKWSQEDRDARRSAAARERFWAEVRAGEREAEARGGP